MINIVDYIFTIVDSELHHHLIIQGDTVRLDSNWFFDNRFKKLLPCCGTISETIRYAFRKIKIMTGCNYLCWDDEENKHNLIF